MSKKHKTATSLVDMSKKDLERQLMSEKDPARVKEIIDLFNLHLKKKEAIRTNQLSELQDKTLSQMEARLEKKADNFSNADLIAYYKTIQDSLSKADTNFDNISIPQIQVNQQINIGSDSPVLTRESRQKVLDAVRLILARADNPEVVASQDEVSYNNSINEKENIVIECEQTEQ